MTFDRVALHAVTTGRGYSLRWASFRELATSGRSYLVRPQDRAAWDARLRELNEELRSGRPAAWEASEALLVLLLIGAIRIAGAVGPAEHAVVTVVTDVIEERFREPLLVSDIAAAVAVSPTHLRRLIKHSTGATVGELLRNRRMDEARRLLRETALSVDAVASASGIAMSRISDDTFAGCTMKPPAAGDASVAAERSARFRSP